MPNDIEIIIDSTLHAIEWAECILSNAGIYRVARATLVLNQKRAFLKVLRAQAVVHRLRYTMVRNAFIWNAIIH